VKLGSGNSHIELNKVVLHEALEVEIGKLIILGKLEELGELGIRVNLAAIGLVLKVVGADILVNLLAHLRASHLRAGGLAEELGELITDTGGLHETGRLPGTRALALLVRSLLGVLHLAGNGLLEGLEVVLDGGENAGHLLKLGTKLGHLRHEAGSIDGLTGNVSDGGSGLNISDGSGHGSDLDLRSLLGARSLDSSNNLISKGGGGGNNFGRGSGLIR